MVIYSYGQSSIYYTVEYDDPDCDDDDLDAGCDIDIAENRFYDNELDARRKQLELWSSEHGQQQHIMDELNALRVDIMQHILKLEKEKL
jgi:ATP-dependent helicase/DNAse subunit B